MLRSLAERLSRNVVLRRKLPPDLGGHFIYVSPECALRFWYPKLEYADNAHLLDIARRFVPNNSIVWDVGANVGLFSFSAAARAKSVFAFEPDPWLASLCSRSASKITNVLILPVAVTNRIDVGELQIAQRGRASNFMSGFGNSQTGGVRRSQPVMTVTLDWLAERFPIPDVVKIDVEGAERQVLEGGTSLLKQASPILICEVASANSHWVTNFLLSLDYKFVDQHLDPTSAAVADIVALPSRFQTTGS